MLNVIIGTEANQLLPQKVLQYSIEKHTKSPVKISPLLQTEGRIGGTNFGFVRFKVPEICGYQGRAIYLDADQLVFQDIHELASILDDKHALALVQDPQGYFGEKKVEKTNQSSVMVLNCDKLTSWKTPQIFESVVPNRGEIKEGQIRYRDFMTLSWFDQSQIQALPPEWNHFNVIQDNTKLVHFSHVRSQPWRTAKHSLSETWGGWLRETIKEGYVSRFRVIWEIMVGHIHPYFLKFIF